MDTPHEAIVISDIALARRLERTEALANAEFVRARAIAIPEVGAESIEVAGALAMYDGCDSPCTQTFGMGMFGTTGEAELEQVEQFYRRHNAPVFHEVCPLADPNFLQLLVESEYVPFEYSNVLFRPILTELSTGAGANSLQVRLVGLDDQKRWADTAAAGWRDVAPELEEYIRLIEVLNPHRTNSHSFLVESSNEPIAAGALSVFDGVALFAGACTIPKWRNQGAQRALLAHRLQFAAEHGCDLAMVVAAPGSASQRNAERAGFRIAYTRIKWKKRDAGN